MQAKFKELHPQQQPKWQPQPQHQQQKQLGHLNHWFCALMIFIVGMIVFQFLMDARSIDICQQDKCRNQQDEYTKDLGRKQIEFDELTSKKEDLKELDRDFDRCMRQMGELKNVDRQEGKEGDQDIIRINAKIAKCSGVIDVSLARFKQAVQRSDL